MKIKKDKKFVIVAIAAITMLIVLIIINVMISNKQKNVEPTDEEIRQIEKEATKSKLADWNEQDRIEYYATNFMRDLEYGNYKLAYECLYKDFKEKYFPTEEKFEQYIKTYFPEEIILEYENMERLSDTYVLWLNIKDGMGEKKDFSMNIVIKENQYDDFDLSFSVDSAMNTDQ